MHPYRHDDYRNTVIDSTYLPSKFHTAVHELCSTHARQCFSKNAYVPQLWYTWSVGQIMKYTLGLVNCGITENLSVTSEQVSNLQHIGTAYV